MTGDKKLIEQRWRKFQQMVNYTDEELAKYRSNPKYVKAMERTPQFVKYKIVIEVLEAHNCIAGYKAGDKFTVDPVGCLILDECPPTLCVAAIAAFKPLVSKMWQAFLNDSIEVFQDTVRCPDVGVHLGGTGEIAMRVHAVPRKEKGK